MIINDAVFGELEFNDHDWIGNKTIEFFEKEAQVALIVSGGDDESLLMNNIPHINYC